MPRPRRLVGACVVLATASLACSGEPPDGHRVRDLVPPTGPVIVVVVDTSRADHLGTYGYARGTSPHLDAWTREGRVYDRAFATAPWTLPSFGSLYTGRWPAVHGAGAIPSPKGAGRKVLRAMDASVSTVAERLGEQGYATGAVVNNPFLDVAFGVARGFEVYDHESGDNRRIRRADVMVDRSLALIDSWRGHPFFLVLHLFDPHMNYDAPAPFEGRFSAGHQTQLSLPVSDLEGLRGEAYDLSEDDVSFLRAAYDEELAFVDQQLGRFRDGLAARELLEESLIILTSDHGEEFFEHGGFEHGHAMWQELLHIPLIVWSGDAVAGREGAPVSLVDIAPTILDWVGLDSHTGIDGVSLLPNVTAGTSLPDRVLFAEGRLYGDEQTAVIEWPLKTVVDADLRPIRINDLEVDPRELTNVLASRADDATRVINRVRERRQAVPSHPSSESPAQPDDDVLDRLRSLGYIR